MNDVANNVVDTSRPTPMSLDQAYIRYQSGKGFGRGDLFRYIIDDIKELQGRIGNVDEAAVAALEKRILSLETVIGNALTRKPADDEPKRKPGRPSNAEVAAREAAHE